MRFQLTVGDKNGYGNTYMWGDTYEVQAEDYAAARADVLGRGYVTVIRGWKFTDGFRWTKVEEAGVLLPVEEKKESTWVTGPHGDGR